MRQLTTAVYENISLAYRMVEHLYGISVKTQIEMAPLCMALLAECSLSWRRKRLVEIDEKTEELLSLGGGNFSFAHAVYRTQEAAATEEESIRKRDVFGKEVDEATYDLGYNPSIENPFVDYLRMLARNAGEADITLDSDGHGIGSSGFPEYRIGEKLLDELTEGESDAEYALACGYVRAADIPEDLFGKENA